MVWTVGALAELCGGTVQGELAREIDDALPLSELRSGCITLLEGRKQYDPHTLSIAAAVVVSEYHPELAITQIVCENSFEAFTKIVGCFRRHPNTGVTGVSPSASVSRTAQIANSASIGANVSIGEEVKIGERCRIHANVSIADYCEIGDDCEIFPNVVLYSGTRLGNRVLIHASAVLGAYGFGYRQKSGRHERTAQLGWVEICDDVEIGAGTTIDRGTFGPTQVGEGTKIDNQVMIGHNCRIGRHNLICAQVGIAGSSSTGDNVVLGGQVGLRDHIHLADGTQVGAQSGVSEDTQPNQTLLGSPAVLAKDHIQSFFCLRKLPEMRRKLKSLESELASLSIKMDTKHGSTIDTGEAA